MILSFSFSLDIIKNVKLNVVSIAVKDPPPPHNVHVLFHEPKLETVDSMCDFSNFFLGYYFLSKVKGIIITNKVSWKDIFETKNLRWILMSLSISYCTSSTEESWIQIKLKGSVKKIFKFIWLN